MDLSCTEEALATNAMGPGRDGGLRRAAVIAASASVHGLIILLLVLWAPLGFPGAHGNAQFVPVELVSLRADAEAHGPQRSSDLPQTEESSVSPSVPDSAGAAPVREEGPVDALAAKLESLAKLHEPGLDRPADPSNARSPDLAAASDVEARGGSAALKDFIRSQIIRHWSLDLGSLGSEDVSVPIKVEISKQGVVLKAEIMDSGQSTDPAFHDIAVSARNAVLSASPLTLPPGDYQSVMDLVLLLNPREALR